MTEPQNSRGGLALPRLLLLAVAGGALLAGCGRNTPVAVPPPVAVTVDPFDTAERAYGQGLFVAAANAYNRALGPDSPTSERNQELALARLALIHAMPDSPLYDLDEARTQLVLLGERFPDSGEDVAVRSLINLQTRIGELEAMIDRTEAHLAALRSTINDLETARSEQSAAIHSLEAEVQQLRASLSATESELETLRRIDRQLRQRN